MQHRKGKAQASSSKSKPVKSKPAQNKTAMAKPDSHGMASLSPEQLLASLGADTVRRLADEADSQLLRLSAREDLASWCRLAGYYPSPHHVLLLDRLRSMSGGHPTSPSNSIPAQLRASLGEVH